MLNLRKSLLPFALIVVFACGMPNTSPPNEDALGTSVAETVLADITQEPSATSTPSAAPINTPTPTPTLIYLSPRVPSETPTWTLAPKLISPSPTPSDTPLPPVVKVKVTRPTHCRSGPGKEYEIVGSFLVGMKAEVVGRDAQANYWYIPNPYVFTDYCWIWGEYAIFEGNQLSVPFVTPPPTATNTATTVPTLSFKLEKSGFYACDGKRWMNFTITNQSDYTFASMRVVFTDISENVLRSIAANSFSSQVECQSPKATETILAKATGKIASPKLDYDFRGHDVQVEITVCSQQDLKGVCGTRRLKFTP